MCNCDIEVKSNFLLESLAACKSPETKTDLEMYFTVNLALVNYFDETIEELGIPILRNWTTQEQILPLSTETFEISPNLLNAPKTLQDLAVQYQKKRNILDKKEQELEKNKRNFKIQIISQQVSGRHIAIHSCTCNYDYNIGDNIHYVHTIKIKSFGSKHSYPMH